MSNMNVMSNMHVMKKIHLILVATAILMLSGCDTLMPGQKEYYLSETARHATETEKWKAMASIANSGDTTAKAVALALMGQSGGGNNQQVTAAPQNPATEWLRFAGALLPSIVQGYSVRQQTQLGMRQSDNGMKQSIAASDASVKINDSTNQAFVGIAGKIQAAGAITNTYSANQANQANQANTTTTTTTTTTSSADQANQANQANTTTTSSADQANQANPVSTTTTTDSSQHPTTTTTDTSNHAVDSHNVPLPVVP